MHDDYSIKDIYTKYLFFGFFYKDTFTRKGSESKSQTN